MANWKDDVRSLVFEYVEEKWLTHGEALVLLRLADYADWKTGRNARPGNWLLAERLAMSEDTVGSALSKGVKLDLIALTKRGGGTGSSKRASNYRFLSEYLPDNSPHVWKSRGSVAVKSRSRTAGKSGGKTTGTTTGTGGVLPSIPSSPSGSTSSKKPTEPNKTLESYVVKGVSAEDEEEALEIEREILEDIEREERYQLERKKELGSQRKLARKQRDTEDAEDDWFS